MTKTLNPTDLSAQLKARFGEGISAIGDYVEVTPQRLLEVAGYLKNESGFDYLDMVTAADYSDHFELVYRLLSTKNNELVSLKLELPRNTASAPSVANLWLGANQQEREIFDLFGIVFPGHPDLRRIALWEGYEGHPLRKDFRDKTYGAGN
jgi:NADH-quinone oxidoreductase subunit C